MQCYTFFCLFQVCCSPVAMLYILLPISSMLFPSGNAIPSSVYFKYMYVVHQWQFYTFFCLFQVCCSPVAIIYLLSISSLLFTSGNHIPSVYFKYVVHQWQSYTFCLFQVCCSPVAILHVYILLSISSMLFTSGNHTCIHSSVYFKYVVHQWQCYIFLLFEVCCSPYAILYLLLSISSMLFTSGKAYIFCDIYSSVCFKYIIHQWHCNFFLRLFQVFHFPICNVISSSAYFKYVHVVFQWKY